MQAVFAKYTLGLMAVGLVTFDAQIFGYFGYAPENFL